MWFLRQDRSLYLAILPEPPSPGFMHQRPGAEDYRALALEVMAQERKNSKHGTATQK
jgi:hypothetical protein